MSVDVVTGCTDPDPRVRLRQLLWRAEVLLDVEEKTEAVACRVEGRAYEGPGQAVAEAGEAVAVLKELVVLHAGDDLGDPVVTADLDQSLATATALVRRLEAMSVPRRAAVD
ncbi:hypothetical protein ACIQVO_36920 [Streptomyces sp. NPDC101062]|uniref:hypothetical protein n=1 Tax=unclassified Streptomyces TaxID=2593676 RepID=UPI00381B5C7C